MKRLIIFAATVIFMISCEKDGQMQPSVGNVQGSIVSINEARIYPLGSDHYLGSEIEFVVASDKQWTVSGFKSRSWMSLKKRVGTKTVEIHDGDTSSAGVTKLVLTAYPNLGGAKRSARLQFSAGSFKEVVDVSQDAPYLKVTSDANHEFGYNQSGGLDIPFAWYEHDNSYAHPEKFGLRIESNIPWTIQTEQSRNYVQASEQKSKRSVDFDALINAGASEEWIRYAKLMSGDRSGNWVNGYVYEEGRGYQPFDLPYQSRDTAEIKFIPYDYNTGEEGYDISYYIVPDGVSELPALPMNFSQPNLRFTIDWTAASGETEYIEFNASDKSSRMLTVNCERPWNVYYDRESDCNVDCYSGDLSTAWLIPSVTSASAGESSFTILPSGDNPGRTARFGMLKLHMNAEGIHATRAVPVKQKQYVFKVDGSEAVSSSQYIANNDLTEKQHTVASSGSWKITGAPSWLSVSPASGIGGSGADETQAVETSITVGATGQNLLLQDRSATLKIAATGNNLYHNLVVTQGKFLWDVRMLEADESDESVVSLATRANADTKFNMDLVCSGHWTIDVAYQESDNKDWLEFSEYYGDATSGKTITFNTTGENMVESKRHATVTVTSTASPDHPQYVFTVEQRGIMFALGEDEVKTLTLPQFDEFNPASQRVEVRTSHPWSVKSYPSWIDYPEIELKDGLDDGFVIITAQNNYTQSPRSGDVVLQSVQGGTTKECTIKVTQAPYRFSISPTSFSAPAYIKNEKFKSSLSSSATWRFTRSDTWFNIKSAKYDGDEELEFSVQHNPTYAQRTGTITLYSDYGGYTASVKFTQEAFVFNSSAKSTYDFEPVDKAVYNFNVECPSPWGFNNRPTWVTLTPSTTEGNGSVTISVVKNTTTSARSQTISLYNAVNGDTHSFTVNQSKYDFSVSDLNSSADLEALNPESRTFNVTCSGDWEISVSYQSGSGWLTLSENSGSGASGRKITMNFTENLDLSSRKATVTVRSKDNSAFNKQFTIVQKAFVFDTAAKTLNFANVSAPAQTFNMTDGTLSTWTVRINDSSWLTATAADGSDGGAGSGAVKISVKDNLETSKRTGTVLIVSDKNAAHKKVVTVNQDAFEFDSKAVSLSFEAADSADQSVSVVRTGKWKVTDVPEWLTVSPASGTGNNSITVTPLENKDSERSAKIKVVSELNSNHVKEITVTQKAAKK